MLIPSWLFPHTKLRFSEVQFESMFNNMNPGAKHHAHNQIQIVFLEIKFSNNPFFSIKVMVHNLFNLQMCTITGK